jgi:hypothetical protein
MRRFQEVLGKANQEVYNPAGLNMLDPSLVAYLFVGFFTAGSAALTRDTAGDRVLLIQSSLRLLACSKCRSRPSGCLRRILLRRLQIV